MDKSYVIPHIVNAYVQPIDQSNEYHSITTQLIEEPYLVSAGLDDIVVELTKAAPDPIVNGKPRMLHITAIIVHEGMNGNGDGFFKEDLAQIVQTKRLFQEGFGGIIDFNHDLDPIGYWYDAELVQDPVTQTTAILAKGAIWAWRFPDMADKILADQLREGHVRVSMACLCKTSDIEFAQDPETGRFIAWHRNPVFVATAVLDMEPGDVNARGIVDEDPVQTTERERRDILLKAASKLGELEDTNLEESIMLDDLKAILDATLGDKAEEVKVQIAAQFEALRAELTQRDTALEDAGSTIVELQDQNTELSTQLEEKNVSIENLRSVQEGLEAKTGELEEELTAYREADQARTFEQVRQTRLAEVSDGVRARLGEKSEEVQEAILTRWAKQSDEEWEETKAEHALVAESNAGGDRREGALPGITPVTEDSSLDRFLK